ncbi:hypothetical protein LSUE1_G008671 [Lachnellula suecica]|uniref:C3H1-type domain-containing protein n=1 Tax=Lachnellula suecica TaxID=602035 RepID=A0A8T9C0W3_9HELO|nr:hypothetical protein LSUE1_G008671 [Lachnellula suecica]
MVLIDGDGMIFNEDLIHQEIEGGKQAAKVLRNSVLEYCSEFTDKIEVMAKVCANITGLSKAMRRAGSLANPGFPQGKASFDFIDVGRGKERADSKIKERADLDRLSSECMRWYLRNRNHNCKQILLGISHDAGYAPFLDKVVTQDDRCRITIIEGTPTFPLLHLHPWAGVTSIAPHPPPIGSPVIVKNGTVKIPTPVPAPASLVWVPGPRGLDLPITIHAAVLDKIKRRTTTNKLCNNHYLRGPCTKGNECCFEHQYKATEEDLKAVAYLARLDPCLNGQDCELEFCIYGYHCPSVIMGSNGNELVCTAFGCRFWKEDHPPGTGSSVRGKRDGRRIRRAGEVPDGAFLPGRRRGCLLCLSVLASAFGMPPI